MESNPKFEASQDLPNFPYARFAELIGRWCWKSTDPNVSPLPPHIIFDQARAYTSAILQGDPDSAAIIKASFKQLFA